MVQVQYFTLCYIALSPMDTSSTSPSSNVSVDDDEPVYKGPFVGRAKVKRDYTPSPYDREALTLKVSHILLYLYIKH